MLKREAALPWQRVAAFQTAQLFQPKNTTLGLILQATQEQIEKARHFARLRTDAHDRRRLPGQSLGSRDRNLRADFFSTLAELLVLGDMMRDGLEPTGYVLYAETAPTGPDFRLDGRSFDIKACLPGCKFVTINEEKRLRGDTDFYLLVRFVSESAVCVYQPVTAAQVGRWELRQGHSLYRSVHASRLTVLQSWSALAEIAARHRKEARR